MFAKSGMKGLGKQWQEMTMDVVSPDREDPCLPSQEDWKSVVSGERESTKFFTWRDARLMTVISDYGNH